MRLDLENICIMLFNFEDLNKTMEEKLKLAIDYKNSVLNSQK